MFVCQLAFKGTTASCRIFQAEIEAPLSFLVAKEIDVCTPCRIFKAEAIGSASSVRKKPYDVGSGRGNSVVLVRSSALPILLGLSSVLCM